MGKKKFQTLDVVGAVRGVLLGEMGGIYKVLNFMTTDTLWTNQLGRASTECKPYVFAQHKWIETLDVSSVHDEPTALALVAQIEKEHGKYLWLTPMPQDDHDYIDVVAELKNQGLGDKLITLDLSDLQDDEISPYGDINF